MANSQKSIAKNLVRLYAKREQSASASPEPGMSKNFGGTYWSDSITDEIIECLKESVDCAPDGPERDAARYSYVANLYEALRLEEARDECERAMNLRGKPAFAERRQMAFIKARLGNMDEALAIASSLNADPNTPRAFRVFEEDLIEEFEQRK